MKSPKVYHRVTVRFRNQCTIALSRNAEPLRLKQPLRLTKGSNERGRMKGRARRRKSRRYPEGSGKRRAKGRGWRQFSRDSFSPPANPQFQGVAAAAASFPGSLKRVSGPLCSLAFQELPWNPDGAPATALAYFDHSIMSNSLIISQPFVRSPRETCSGSTQMCLPEGAPCGTPYVR